jgi:hypothetical protein
VQVSVALDRTVMEAFAANFVVPASGSGSDEVIPAVTNHVGGKKHKYSAQKQSRRFHFSGSKQSRRCYITKQIAMLIQQPHCLDHVAIPYRSS